MRCVGCFILELFQSFLEQSNNERNTLNNFIYLGSWIESTEREIRVRKGKAWGALHRVKDIWKSKLSKSLKIRLFIAACESVLLCGSETWTLTKDQEES